MSNAINLTSSCSNLSAIGFVKIKLDDGAFAPKRAHPYDAGLDLRAKEDMVIPPREGVSFDTGVHIEIPRGYFGKIESKSGLNVKHSVVSCGGTIDCGYTGSIIVRLYNLSDVEYQVRAGDKIAQLIIEKCELLELWLVDGLEETERGESGFGSTGR